MLRREIWVLRPGSVGEVDKVGVARLEPARVVHGQIFLYILITGTRVWWYGQFSNF